MSQPAHLVTDTRHRLRELFIRQSAGDGRRFRHDWLGRPRVLWIDDDRRLLDEGSAVLRRAGFVVASAERGTDGLAQACGADIILLDLQLPDMSGAEVLQRLDQSGVEALVLVLTAFAEALPIREAMRFGARGFLHKPCSDEALLDAVKQQVDRPRYRHALRVGDELIDALDRVELASALVGTPATAQLLQALLGCLLEPAVPVPLFLASGRLLAALLMGCDVNSAALDKALSDLWNAALHPRGLQGRLTPEVVEVISRLEHADHWSKPLRLVDLAEAVGYRTSDLADALCRETGVTFDEWRWCLRVRTVMYPLLHGRDYVAQIAYRSGYEHPGQFDREFKHLFGVPPTTARSLLAKAGHA